MMHRVHESVLIAKLTLMRKAELKRMEPDAEAIAAMDRQLSRRPQSRQINPRRKHA